MNKQKLIAAVGIVLITTLILAGNSFGQEGVTHYGVKAGLVTPGEVTIEGLGSDDGDISYSFGGFLDYGLAAKLSGGLSLDLHNAKYGEFSKTLIDFSLTLKALVRERLESGQDVPADLFKPFEGNQTKITRR